MKQLIIYWFVAVLLSATNNIYAQDPQFSQLYAAPIYLNPAFAGGGKTNGRMGVNYRNQWSSLGDNFQTVSANLDYSFTKSGWGFGTIINQQKESHSKFTSLDIGAITSYSLPLSKVSFLSLGVQYSYFEKSIYFDELIFGNQLDIVNGQVIGLSGEPLDGGLKMGFSSLSAGLVFYTNSSWLGISVHHFNSPDQSFSDSKSNLAPKISFQGGLNVSLTTFAFNYKTQGGFNQFDLVLEQKLIREFDVAVGYRGMIWDKDNKVESLIPSIRITVPDSKFFSNNPNERHNKWIIGISYDITLSKLKASTGSTYEISLTFIFGKNQKDYIPCVSYK